MWCICMQCDGITLHAYTSHVCMCEDVWYIWVGRCVCVVHAHLICNGHQDVMESSEILGISHRGTVPRHVDIVPLSLPLPNIGVASVWSAGIEHPVFIAMKRDIVHIHVRDYNVSIISCEPIRKQSSNAAVI